MRELLCAVMIVCSTLWGVIGFLNQNVEVLHPSALSEILIAYTVFLSIMYLLFWLLRVARVSRELSAIAVSLFSVILISYANAKALTIPYLQAYGLAGITANWPYIFLLLAIIPLGLALYAQKDKYNIFKYALVFFVVLSAGSVPKAIEYSDKRDERIRRDISQEATLTVAKSDKPRPNVYFIILDGYTAHENMKQHFGFDNSKFLKALQQKGFFISTKALSNHDNTLCTVTTMTNMNYLPVSQKGVTEFDIKKSTLFQGRFCPTFKEMGALGYTIILSTLGAQMSIGPDGDAISPSLSILNGQYKGRSATYVLPTQQSDNSIMRLSQAESAFLSLSPLMDLLTKLKLNVPSQYSELSDIDLLLSMKDKLPTPYFYYGHILLPHLPGRYDKSCRPKSGNQLLRQDFNDDITSTKARVNDYSENAQCVSHQFEEFVDKIIEHDPNSIIIVTADHGVTYHGRIHQPNKNYKSTIAKGITPEEREKRMIIDLQLYSDKKDINDAVRTKYGILSGYRLPGGKTDSEWYDGMSPVNYFRWLLRKLGRDDIKYLPDRVFIGNDVNHYFLDVTNLIQDDRKPTGPFEPAN